MTKSNMAARLIIDGRWFSEFIKKHKNERILRKDLRTSEILRNLGLKKADPSIREAINERFFEAFLLRSLLYRIAKDNPEYLEPFLITGNWYDYADSWKISKESQLHYPFRGKIAFQVFDGAKKWLVCHPRTSSIVDKILFEPGLLSLRIPGVDIIPNHKAEVCKSLLEFCNSKLLGASDLEAIRKKTYANPERFLVVLEYLGLSLKKEAGYVIKGEGLFCDEIQKTTGFYGLEKAARVILRRDSEKMMYITNILLWLESLEKESESWIQSIGSGKEEKDWFAVAARDVSLNTLAVVNVLREFSKFDAFLEYYPRELVRGIGYECYSTLSCHVDSLGLIWAHLYGGLDLDHVFKTSLKIEKFKRHVEFLLRFIDKESLTNALQSKNVSLLRRKLTNSDMIDLHLIDKDTNQVDADRCLSNIFLVSKLPVKDEYFKTEVLETLKGPHLWKQPQGHFYYPDFRFIMSAKLGLTFNAFDRVLAYQIQNDVDFYSRLFLPILWGRRFQRQRIDESLTSVVPEPFDSISLRY